MTLETSLIELSIEWFLYGKISILCVLTCTLFKEVQSFPGLGIYSGIFAVYLQRPQNKSGTASIIFYALCVLYVLSTVSALLDLVAGMIEIVSNNSICKNIIFKNSVVQILTENSDNTQLLQSFEFHISIVQGTVSGCCDFLAQSILVRILNHFTYHPFYSPKSSKIYRCWIVWGQIISVVIVPSFLAIAYLGQSRSIDPHSSYSNLIKIYRLY